MPRLKAEKRAEMESFWRAHLEGWRRSDLNQREYCELHGLPLKRFGNWRATLRPEEPASASKLLYRRGGGLKPIYSDNAALINSSEICAHRAGEPPVTMNLSAISKAT